MVKLVITLPEPDRPGFFRQVWEGETVSESFIIVGMEGNHFEKAIHERNMEISRLLTREARITARENRFKQVVDSTHRAILSLMERS